MNYIDEVNKTRLEATQVVRALKEKISTEEERAKLQTMPVAISQSSSKGQLERLRIQHFNGSIRLAERGFSGAVKELVIVNFIKFISELCKAISKLKLHKKR